MDMRPGTLFQGRLRALKFGERRDIFELPRRHVLRPPRLHGPQPVPAPWPDGGAYGSSSDQPRISPDARRNERRKLIRYLGERTGRRIPTAGPAAFAKRVRVVDRPVGP